MVRDGCARQNSSRADLERRTGRLSYYLRKGKKRHERILNGFARAGGGTAGKGETQGRIAEVLGLSMSTVKRYLVRYQQTGKGAATVQGRMQARLGEAELRVLAAELRAQPDARQTYAERLAAQTGIVVSPMSISRALRRLGWTRKKRQWWPASVTR